MRRRTIIARTKGLCLTEEALQELFVEMKNISDSSTKEGCTNFTNWTLALAKAQAKYVPKAISKFGAWSNLHDR